VDPRPSATVILIRAGEPWRLLMMRRPGGAEFAPSAYVFPGGSVHDEDRGFPDATRSAALRELFEEVGVLLARRPGGRFARDAECRRLRAALAAGSAWPRALEQCRLAPAFDRLVFYTRWVTPEPMRRRFDTHFYLARRPPGQTVHPQAGEVEDWMWIEPLAALSEGGPAVVHATRRILEALASEPDAGRLVSRMRRRRGTEAGAIMPRVVRLDDGGLSVEDDWPAEPRSVGSGGQRQRSRQRS